MMDFKRINKKLRSKNKNQYYFMLGSILLSVLLITSYLTIINSRTVQRILPPGGDSRKQMMMIFTIAVIGCIVFVNYAIGLFLRYKSREVGVLMALGTSKKKIEYFLIRDILTLVLIVSFIGIGLGVVFALGIWKLFRIFIVDTPDMVLNISYKAIALSALFTLVIIILSFIRMKQFINRTNIIDIVQESKKSEPIKDVPSWYGFVGILLMLIGGFLGYSSSGFIIEKFSYFPPDWLSGVFYLPALIGLYMIMLHTVVKGWGGRKNKYKNIISTSMMKFEGRQTVRNMIVITLLVAGGYFASFYTPLMLSASENVFKESKVDYSFNYRQDQKMISKDDVFALAKEEDVEIIEYRTEPMAILGVDGELETVEGNRKITFEYKKILKSGRFLSKEAYNRLTGENITIKPGEVITILSNDGSGDFRTSEDLSLITNTVTGEEMKVTPSKLKLRNNSLFGYRILSNEDYEKITRGLTPEWLEKIVFFNVKNPEASYDFANLLFDEIVEHSDSKVEQFLYWDPVSKIVAEKEGKEYDIDSYKVDYRLRDSSDFRSSWKYMPNFGIMNKMDFLKQYAVFLLLFVFIAIICFSAVIVILYVRSLTTGLNSKRVYEDLKRIGANNNYLQKSMKSQISKIFLSPTLIGTIVIVAFYTMILYSNDGQFTEQEFIGFGISMGVVIVMSAIIYVLYKLSFKKTCKILNIL